MDKATLGWVNGLIGVIIFSASLPATRLAVSGLDPVFVTTARAAVAGLLAGGVMLASRNSWPERRYLPSLGIVSFGVVIGFPLLTALALRHVTSAHSVVFIGILPLMTSIFAVIRGGERPRPAFWLFSVLGSLLVASFAWISGGDGLVPADGLMALAVIICGLGYAEGARLSRSLGGLQVISWALVISLPVMVPLSLLALPAAPGAVPVQAWLGLAYVAIFSMFVGFIFWYRGLADGGTASVGQLQLLQPFFGLILSWLVLGEQVTPLMFAVAAGVCLTVFAARRQV